jgi:hypothetical protein
MPIDLPDLNASICRCKHLFEEIGSQPSLLYACDLIAIISGKISKGYFVLAISWRIVHRDLLYSMYIGGVPN